MKELAQALVFGSLGFLGGWVLGCRVTRRTMEQAQRAIWKAARNVRDAELEKRIRYAASLPEVECPKCGIHVISSCKSRNGCPIPDKYAARAAGRE